MTNLDEIDMAHSGDFKGLTEAERAVFEFAAERSNTKEKMEIARGIADYLLMDSGYYDKPENLPDTTSSANE